MPRTPQQLADDIQAIWRAGVEAVKSDALVRANVRVEGETLLLAEAEFSLGEIDRIVVVGGGKAGTGMVQGLIEALGPEVLAEKRVSGIVSVPEDCVPKNPVRGLTPIDVSAGRPAGDNSPTEAGVQLTARMLDLVGTLTPRDLCICLISGGGSALLPAPVEGITLAQKHEVTRFLSGAGANIEQLNTVRKQLSRIKGNGLARACRGGHLVSLIISDVLGDPLDVIASGPTVTNKTTPADALHVLLDFKADQQPGLGPLVAYVHREVEEKRPAIEPSCVVQNFIIGNNAVAVDAAGIEAERRGYSHAMLAAREMEGPAEEIGAHLARMAVKMRSEPGPDCLITGGEPVVHLVAESERGKGGRNQQLVLAGLATLMENEDANPLTGIALLSGGTDGEDGPTDAAGAWLDAAGFAQMQNEGLEPLEYLRRNDAYHFFQPLGRLLQTGPTHTNVCDVRVVVVDRIQPQPAK